MTTNQMSGLIAYAEREIENACAQDNVDLPRLTQLHDLLAACRELELDTSLSTVQVRVKELVCSTLKLRACSAKAQRSLLFANLMSSRVDSLRVEAVKPLGTRAN